MAKRIIKEKELIEHLQREGLKEIKETEKHAKWYKKARECPFCLKELQSSYKSKKR